MSSAREAAGDAVRDIILAMSSIDPTDENGKIDYMIRRIAAAILAERSACEKIATDEAERLKEVFGVANRIAAAIRARE